MRTIWIQNVWDQSMSYFTRPAFESTRLNARFNYLPVYIVNEIPRVGAVWSKLPERIAGGAAFPIMAERLACFLKNLLAGKKFKRSLAKSSKKCYHIAVDSSFLWRSDG